MVRAMGSLFVSILLIGLTVMIFLATRTPNSPPPAVPETVAVSDGLNELGEPGFAETLMFMRSPTGTVQLQRDRMAKLTELQQGALTAHTERMGVWERLEELRIAASVEKAGIVKSGLLMFVGLAVVTMALLVVFRLGMTYLARPHAPAPVHIHLPENARLPDMRPQPPPALVDYAKRLRDAGHDACVEYDTSAEFTGWQVVDYTARERLTMDSSPIRALLTG